MASCCLHLANFASPADRVKAKGGYRCVKEGWIWALVKLKPAVYSTCLFCPSTPHPVHLVNAMEEIGVAYRNSNLKHSQQALLLLQNS